MLILCKVNAEFGVKLMLILCKVNAEFGVKLRVFYSTWYQVIRAFSDV